MSRESEISKQVQAEFNPSYFKLMNESGQHRHSADGESHFRLVLVSEKFDGLGKVQRHRLVYSKLDRFFSQGLHALALELWTVSEWEKSLKKSVTSPPCEKL